MKSYKFRIRGNNYDVEIKEAEGNQFKLEVNGSTYDVKLDREVSQQKTPTLVRSAVQTHKPLTNSNQQASSLSKITCPLPGNIISILVKEGQAVKKGEKLLMYEAMKMENEILADKDGTIASIKVNVGDAVLQDDLLIEIK